MILIVIVFFFYCFRGNFWQTTEWFPIFKSIFKYEMLMLLSNNFNIFTDIKFGTDVVIKFHIFGSIISNTRHFENVCCHLIDYWEILLNAYKYIEQIGRHKIEWNLIKVNKQIVFNIFVIDRSLSLSLNLWCNKVMTR